MKALQTQSLLYCAIASAVTVASAVATMFADAMTNALLAPASDGITVLLLAAALILLLGVPHGALDTVFAERLHGVRGWRGRRGWIAFASAYMGAALLVLLAWYSAPHLLLPGFLLLSALHFSGDPAPGTGFIARLLYGGASIVLPALLHQSEMARLFAFLAPAQVAAALADVLHQLSGPWLLAMALMVLVHMRANWLTGVEMAATAALTVLVSPLLAFAVFFCLMHSARHIVRTWQQVAAEAKTKITGATTSTTISITTSITTEITTSTTSERTIAKTAAETAAEGTAAERTATTRLLRAALLPMLGTLILGGFAACYLHYLRAQPLEASLIQWLFIGLAALTVPHMALVEQVRWRGWPD
jgi:Brp/Blh family beta-carotene 15,15'-monooxygenase